jgi:hypothetical protein
MRSPRPALAPLLAALVVAGWPAAARAGETLGLTLEAWGAVSRYDVGGLRQGVENADWGRDLLQERVNSYGVSALLRLGNLDVGALYEGKLVRDRTDAAIITPLVGFAINLGTALRLDLLGELGGHRITNVQFAGEVDVSQARSVWLPYVGARPTLTLRFPAGPTHLVLSVAPFVRWDLVKRRITLASGSTEASTSTYDVGGATFGVSAGAGFEL